MQATLTTCDNGELDDASMNGGRPPGVVRGT
jgi:hypothetical protein